MKKINKLMSMILVLAMLASAICVMPVFATGTAKETISTREVESYDFEPDTQDNNAVTIPDFLTGGTAVTDGDRNVIKFAPTETKSVNFDVSDFKGKPRALGVLKYSFDFKMVDKKEEGSGVNDPSIGIRFHKSNETGHTDGVGDWHNTACTLNKSTWNRSTASNKYVGSEGTWHSVEIYANAMKKTTAVVVDGVKNNHDQSYSESGKDLYKSDPRDATNLSWDKINYYTLWLVMTTGHEYYIDNLKAEYSENGVIAGEDVVNFTLADEGEQMNSYDVVDNVVKYTVGSGASKTLTNFDANVLKGRMRQNGKLKYSFKYKVETDDTNNAAGIVAKYHTDKDLKDVTGVDGKKLSDGTSTVAKSDLEWSNHIATFYSDRFNRSVDTKFENKGWHEVEIELDYNEKTVCVKVDGVANTETVDKWNKNNPTQTQKSPDPRIQTLTTSGGKTYDYIKDKLFDYFKMNFKLSAGNSEATFYIADVKAEYTEDVPVDDTAVKAFNGEAYTLPAVKSDTEKVTVDFGVPMDEDAGTIGLYKLDGTTLANTTTGTGSWNAEKSVYTIDLTSNMLAKGSTYKLQINGVRSSRNIPLGYDAVYTLNVDENAMLYMVGEPTMWQKTGEAAYAEVTAVADVTGASSVKGVAEFVNTNVDAQPVKYLFAMYEDGVLKNVFVEEVTANIGVADAEEEFDISGVNKNGIDKVTLFVWDGTMVKPLGVSKSIPAAE